MSLRAGRTRGRDEGSPARGTLGRRDDRRTSRSRPRRRTLRLLAPARAGGLLGMLVAGLILRLVTSSSAFALERIDQPSLHWTADDAVLASVAIPLGTNVFGIVVAPIEARIAALPGIASAHISVALPATIAVAIVERTPILAWRVGDTAYLVDRDGVIFATTDALGAAAANLPTISDERVASPFSVAVGASLDAVDLDVATRLAALTPADIGSSATRLEIRVTDADGYVVHGDTTTWVAVFGFYSPSLRSSDLIPGQVQLLRSLLAGRESTVDRVILADDRNGTYTVKPTPKPTKKP